MCLGYLIVTGIQRLLSFYFLYGNYTMFQADTAFCTSSTNLAPNPGFLGIGLGFKG